MGLDHDRIAQTVEWECDNCAEPLRGEPGAIGRCGYCGDWQDAPYAQAIPEWRRRAEDQVARQGFVAVADLTGK